jgi:hypothetical protein
MRTMKCSDQKCNFDIPLEGSQIEVHRGPGIFCSLVCPKCHHLNTVRDLSAEGEPYKLVALGAA